MALGDITVTFKSLEGKEYTCSLDSRAAGLDVKTIVVIALRRIRNRPDGYAGVYDRLHIAVDGEWCPPEYIERTRVPGDATVIVSAVDPKLKKETIVLDV